MAMECRVLHVERMLSPSTNRLHTRTGDGCLQGVVSCCPSIREPASSSPPPHSLRTIDRTGRSRSEEHTSELQSQSNLVCRLLLEKKKKNEHNNVTWPNIHERRVYLLSVIYVL